MAKTKDKDKNKKNKPNPSSQTDQTPSNAEPTEQSQTIIDVRIKTISETPDHKTAPILGYFPSGFNPLTNENARPKLYRSVKSRNPRNPRMQLVVGVDGSPVSFSGTNYTREAATPQSSCFSLGVLDKETGVLKIVPIAGNRVFRLDPKIKGLELPDDQLPENPGSMQNTYNSKKDKRRDEKRQIQTKGAGNQEEVDVKLKGIKINMEALEDTTSVVNAQNIPPYNLDATSSERAYPLEKMILKGDWDHLMDIFNLVEAGSEVSPAVYPSFVCNRADKLKDMKNASKKKEMAAILSYITHLIKFKDRHSMDGVSSAKSHKTPSILLQRFSSMFGTTESKRIPIEKQNLLISYVLVLSLFADDFRSDPEDLKKDLRMNLTDLKAHYGYIGSKFVRENQVFIATLPVPLKFETLKRKRKR